MSYTGHLCVGHETDTGLTDLVADIRAATPSQAAEIATPDIRDIRRQLSQFEGRLTSRTDILIALDNSGSNSTHKLSTAVSQQTQRSRERLRQLENVWLLRPNTSA